MPSSVRGGIVASVALAFLRRSTRASLRAPPRVEMVCKIYGLAGFFNRLT